ncbi:hypothetical protein Bca4012_024211 [Brassica carinata]
MSVVVSSKNSGQAQQLNGDDELIVSIPRSSLHAIIESRVMCYTKWTHERVRSVALPLSNRELCATRCFLTYYSRTSVDKVSLSNIPSTQLLNLLLFLCLSWFLVILRCIGWSGSYI